MSSVLAYVRSLLFPDVGRNRNVDINKRERTGFNLADDEEVEEIPDYKRLKLRKPMTDLSDHQQPTRSRVHYVPIQIERKQPSTSTPHNNVEPLSRARRIPIQLDDGTLVEGRKMTTPTRCKNSYENHSNLLHEQSHRSQLPEIHSIIDDEDDDDPEVAWIEPKTHEYKANAASPHLYVNLDEDDDDDDEVILVKKVSNPQTQNPYKFFLSKNNLHENEMRSLDGATRYRRINRSSPKFSRFKAPSGVTKSYKQRNTTKWLNPLKTTTSSMYHPLARNRLSALNENARSALASVFNLDEKKSYQELIKRTSRIPKPSLTSKHVSSIIDLSDDDSFRSTIRTQKKGLDEINLLERGLIKDRNIEKVTEYDPITVASINSSDSEIEIVGSETSSSSVRISPVNSFKDYLKDNKVVNTSWVSDIENKYNKKRRETQEKLKDTWKECNIISKLNHEQNIAQLERKLRTDLCLPESLIEEEVTEPLPKLTPEQENLVKRAWAPGPDVVLIDKFSLRIHRRDISTLAGLNWLNDEVINFYMNLLMQRCEERKNLPKVYATNTFFYERLVKSGYAGLRRWTRKVDLFAHDLMIIPVHLGVHWCLSIVKFNEKRVEYLDSMSGRNFAALEAIFNYLKEEHQDKKGQPFDDSGWKKECLKDIPQQMNGSDCGMFACTFAEFTCRKAKYTFTQADMPYLRRKMVVEIIQGKLLL